MKNPTWREVMALAKTYSADGAILLLFNRRRGENPMIRGCSAATTKAYCAALAPVLDEIYDDLQDRPIAEEDKCER